jgi:hypothetical protein
MGALCDNDRVLFNSSVVVVRVGIAAANHLIIILGVQGWRARNRARFVAREQLGR